MIHELGLVSAARYYDDFNVIRMETKHRHFVFRHCGAICACIYRFWALILNIFLDCKTCASINVRCNAHFCIKFVSCAQWDSLSEEHYFPTADLLLNGMSKMTKYYLPCDHPVPFKHALKVIEQLHDPQMYFNVSPYFVLLPHANIKMLYTKYKCHHFFFQREENDKKFFHDRMPSDFFFFCFVAEHTSHRVPSLKTRCLEVIVLQAVVKLFKNLNISWQGHAVTICMKCIESKTNDMFHAYLPKVYIDEIIFYVKYSLPGYFICDDDNVPLSETIQVFRKCTVNCTFKEVCLCFDLINLATSPLQLTQ